MPMEPGPHVEELQAAIRVEAAAQRALLGGDEQAGAAGMADAATHYRASWELAPPRSFGRLVGMLKAAVLSGGPVLAAAEYVREQIGTAADSPPACYALALAALVLDDDAAALRAAAGMPAGSEAFGRAGAAIEALAARDGDAYATALRAILDDFEGREDHLTGVPIADTALMLERLAASRGLAAGLRSPLLPAG